MDRGIEEGVLTRDEAREVLDADVVVLGRKWMKQGKLMRIRTVTEAEPKLAHGEDAARSSHAAPSP